jgi:hypothetical protein
MESRSDPDPESHQNNASPQMLLITCNELAYTCSVKIPNIGV